MRDLPADWPALVPVLPGSAGTVRQLRPGPAGRGGTLAEPRCRDCTVPAFRRLPGLRRQPAAGPVRQLPAGTAAPRAAGRPRWRHLPLAPPAEGSAGGHRPPATALRWLAKPPVAAALSQIAAGGRDLSHGELDRLEQTPVLAHLRSVMVATGTLPPRDEVMAQLERFAADVPDCRPDPEQRQVLRRYATWHLLRRLAAGTTAGRHPGAARRRAAAGPRRRRPA